MDCGCYGNHIFPRVSSYEDWPYNSSSIVRCIFMISVMDYIVVSEVYGKYVTQFSPLCFCTVPASVNLNTHSMVQHFPCLLSLKLEFHSQTSCTWCHSQPLYTGVSDASPKIIVVKSGNVNLQKRRNNDLL